MLAALCWVAALRGASCAARRRAERFLWLLIAGGLLCLLIPELVYVRDAFDGSDLYRMNTVFKLGYQAWLLLAIAGAPRARRGRGAGCAAARGSRRWRGRSPLLVLLALGAVYPYAGTYARKGGFAARADARRAAAGCASARPATRARSTGCATTRRTARSCSRRSATTTRRSATRGSRRSPACRP